MPTATDDHSDPGPGPDDAGSSAAGADGDHGEPNYLGVWGGLAALTLLEVWVASLGLGQTTLVLTLVGLAIWKALLVALYYMHLKFEPRRLWVLAVAPLPLAVILVVAVMQEF